jgi:hypothetical protein
LGPRRDASDSEGFPFAELVIGLCWLSSLVLPLYFGLRLSRPPTVKDLVTPFPSGGWVRFSIKFTLPIELGGAVAVILGIDGRVPVLARVPVWLLIGMVTVAAMIRGFGRAPRASPGGGSIQDGTLLPSYEEGYARTIAALEDSLESSGQARRRRRRTARADRPGRRR